MKHLVLFFTLFSVATFAQKARKLEPILRHYKTLAALSPKAQRDSTDRKHFPIDGMSPKTLLRLKIKPKYLILPGNEIVLPPFPANSSAQTKAELVFLHDLEKTRTPEKVEECKTFAGVFYNVNTKVGDEDYAKMQRNLFHMIRQIDGLNAENLPKTAQMMRDAWTDCTYYFWYHKFAFNRTRPYMLDSTLKPVDTGTNFQAYPSGHASASYMAAYVYQELFPEHKDLLLKNAFEMGYSREIIGVHFPSDSEAGRDFARKFVNLLFENPKFKADFEIAKAEVAAFQNSQKKK
jgi:acid phosphatase (class A)